jgi:hypothetical protein
VKKRIYSAREKKRGHNSKNAVGLYSTQKRFLTENQKTLERKSKFNNGIQKCRASRFVF